MLRILERDYKQTEEDFILDEFHFARLSIEKDVTDELISIDE